MISGGTSCLPSSYLIVCVAGENEPTSKSIANRRTADNRSLCQTLELVVIFGQFALSYSHKRQGSLSIQSSRLRVSHVVRLKTKTCHHQQRGWYACWV